jgi:hypothetical protein
VSRANGPSSGGNGSRLFPLLEEFAPRKNNFNHDGLDGTSLNSPGLVPLPGQGRRMEQHEALSGSLVSPIVAFFIDRENKTFGDHEGSSMALDFAKTEVIGPRDDDIV